MCTAKTKADNGHPVQDSLAIRHTQSPHPCHAPDSRLGQAGHMDTEFGSITRRQSRPASHHSAKSNPAQGPVSVSAVHGCKHPVGCWPKNGRGILGSFCAVLKHLGGKATNSFPSFVSCRNHRHDMYRRNYLLVTLSTNLDLTVNRVTSCVAGCVLIPGAKGRRKGASDLARNRCAGGIEKEAPRCADRVALPSPQVLSRHSRGCQPFPVKRPGAGIDRVSLGVDSQ
ncbi:hypothetical protein F5144DRAFT_581615 [Chaetomium tenue]|uniref:Uncharacterized protein n=1 Tax=Chaetomium tenue TaxID=1854479 RepID=A0ACB7NXK1_9PEZI|nr:hypothetical protein F5144DRAFT_581615 [Chaetomium globosum]